jgi:ubiquinone/menaquinone biosynthesis C-methylase UbiE
MNDPQTDPDFLKEEAYGEASALDTRIRLQEECGKNPQEWFAWLFEHLDLPEKARVLELGCGPGDLWQRASGRMSTSWQILLTDLSEGMVMEAHSRVSEGEASFFYAAVDSQNIPFPAESFDAVIGNGLIDHVPERGRALGEIERVLRPGGVFYTSTGSRSHLQEISEWVQPFLPEADFGGAAERFGLENGERLLSPWFCEIKLFLYHDRLIFNKVEPLLEYVLSEPQSRAGLTGKRLHAFRTFIQEKLQEQGSLDVIVDKGLFLSKKT